MQASIAHTQDLAASARAAAGAGLQVARVLRTTFHVLAHNAKGELLWEDDLHNLVTTQGLNDALTQHLKGVNYTAAWYVGLAGDSPVFAAGDTLASHSGWTEIAAYTGSRPQIVLGTAAGGIIDSVASPITITINADNTHIGGLFTCNAASGTSGVLYGGAAASANRVLANGDQFTISYVRFSTAAA